MIYADYNATTPLGGTAQQRMREAFECWGNPSSSHKLGRKALELLENSRRSVADPLGVGPLEVVFTSGGSEANTLALLGSHWSTQPAFRLLTSKVEHSSVRDTAALLERQGAQVDYVRLTAEGALDLEDFFTRVREFRPHLVSLMAANNETGVLFPVSEIAPACAEAGAILHTDAVQAFGKVRPSHWQGARLVSISAHKIHGPKGVGALWVGGGRQLVPTHYGGSQEVKRRGGTENMVGIAGFGGACEELPAVAAWEALGRLRDGFEARLQTELPGVAVNGGVATRLPNTSNLRFEGVTSEVLLSALDLDGVYVSAGSACSSGSISPSHVLLAMGLGAQQARESVRFSWGRETTPEEIDSVAELVINHVRRIRNRKSRS